MPHRKKYSAIVLLVLISCLHLAAQEDSTGSQPADTNGLVTEIGFPVMSETDEKDLIDAAAVEKTSYQLYLNKDWRRLSDYCNEAIHLQFDYYYLRVRAGCCMF